MAQKNSLLKKIINAFIARSSRFNEAYRNAKVNESKGTVNFTTEAKLIEDYDVVVIGAGISGITAAISSARRGMKTLLIEKTGTIGGLITGGLVTPFSMQMVMPDNSMIIRGICEELFNKLADKDGTIKDWADWKIPKLPVDAEIFKIVISEMIEDSNIDLILSTSLVGCSTDDSEITSVVIHNRDGFSSIRAKFFIDCSGEADLARLAKVPTTINADVDPNRLKVVSETLLNAGWTKKTEKTASMQFLVSDVNFQKVYEFILRNPSYYSETTRGELVEDIDLFKYLWKRKGFFYFPHTNSFKTLINSEKEKGNIKTKIGDYVLMEDAGLGIDGMSINNTAIINANRVIVNPFNEESVTSATSSGYKVCFEIFSFLKRTVPGFENSVFQSTASMLGIRRGAQIIGDHIYTAEERMEFRKYKDVIGLASRKTSKYYEIPYSLMLPRGIKNLLVASGKTVSTDDFLPYRTKPICMVLGESAGVAASICVSDNQTNRTLGIQNLQNELLKQNVFLGTEERLRSLGLK
tara:strand:- start:367 stop:1938 length:1572 start_codon:yes stop_codon:yes gene_type:complete